MAEQDFWIDTDRLRAETAELHRIAAETAQIAAELRDAHDRQGVFWGDDAPGKAFGAGYEPDLARDIGNFDDLAANLRALGSQISRAGESFQYADSEGAATFNAFAPYPANASNSDPGRTFAADDPVGGSTSQPAGTTRLPGETDTAPRRAYPTGGPGVGATPSTTGESSPPGGSDSPGGGTDPGRSGSGGPAQRTTEPEQAAPGGLPQFIQSGPAGRSGAVPSSTAAGGPASSPVPAGGAGPSPRSSSNTKLPGSPWDKAPGRGSPPAGVSPPNQEIPPRPPAPVRPRRPDGPVRPDGKQERTAGRPPQRAVGVAAPSRPMTDDEAMRIAREMAQRHNLEISGFEAAGISVRTVQAMADAVDHILPKYPGKLCGIAIEEGGADLSWVEDRADRPAPQSADEVSSHHPVQPWIVLDGPACATPSLFGGAARFAARDAIGAVPDPMYTTILLEFGRVLDLASSFRARREAQRALITEHLRISGVAGETLACVVEGYKQWRAELGGWCFDNGALSPGRALAVGFADVESRGSEACGPGKVLHRVLSVVASSDTR